MLWPGLPRQPDYLPTTSFQAGGEGFSPGDPELAQWLGQRGGCARCGFSFWEDGKAASLARRTNHVSQLLAQNLVIGAYLELGMEPGTGGPGTESLC